MNVDELKKLVKHSTAVLVLDNGEPSFAILSYETYKDLVLGGKEMEIKINPVRSLARDKVASPEDLGEATSNGINHHIANGVPIKPALPDNELEILERINKDILALKSEIEKEEKMITVDPFDKAQGQY